MEDTVQNNSPACSYASPSQKSRQSLEIVIEYSCDSALSVHECFKTEFF
jgi:hypothetical protein